MSIKSWFILQYKPNAHRVALRNLQHQGFETFLPMHEVTQKKSTKFVLDVRPLFPGYMFIAFELENAPWRKINSTMGVSRLVSFDGQPRALPPDLVSGLMLRCDASGKILPRVLPCAGDEVRVLSGPFTNFIATVEALSGPERIGVLIDLMGRKVRTSVPSTQIEKLG